MSRRTKRSAPTEPSTKSASQKAGRSGKRRIGPPSAVGPKRGAAAAVVDTAVVGPEDAVPPAALPLTPEAWRQCDGLLEFFQATGVDVEWGNVRMDPDPATTGWRITSHRDLPRNALLGTVPKSACLSVLTTSIAAELVEDGLTGGLGLTVAVLVERALGPASRWALYLSSLPHHVPLPVFWGEAELAELRGTELDGAVPGELGALTDDYDRHVRPFVKKHLRGQSAVIARCGLDEFRIAASLVASRAFHVDPEHGDAMVPFADIFNHRSAVIMLGSGVVIEGYRDPDEGPEGGGDDDSDGQDEEGDEGDEEALAAVDGAAELDDEDSDAAMDDSNAATGMAICVTVRDELKQTALHPEHPLNIAICNKDEDPITGTPAALEIVLMHSVGKDAEIWNTYGELSNGALLMKYGFCTQTDNPHSMVNVDFDLALRAIEAHTDHVVAATAEDLLGTEGIFDDDGLFEIGTDATLPAALVFLVHCVAGGADAKFTKDLRADPVATAASADPAQLLLSDATRLCLRTIVLSRLALYTTSRAQELGDADAAARSLDKDARALARAQTIGRSYPRIASLLLRVGEQRILLAALAKL